MFPPDEEPTDEQVETTDDAPAPETPAEETPKTEEQRDAEVLEAVSKAVDEATPAEVLEAKKPAEKPKDEAKPDDKPADKAPDKAPVTITDPAAAKPKDFVNDPLPPNLKAQTKERMEGLISTVKATQAELETVRTRAGELWEQIEKTGTTADQFGATMRALEQVNSTDPAERRKGIAALRQFADAVAKQVGDDIPGVDPLDEHQDLLDDVESGNITRERAVEIAKHRDRAKVQEQQTAQQVDMQSRQAHAAAVNAGYAEMNAYGQQLRARDGIVYEQKIAVLKPLVTNMAKMMPPAQWKAWFTEQYNAVQLPGVAQIPNDGRQRVPAGTGTNQPMRPKQPAGGGGQRAPQSLEEALELTWSRS